MRSRSVGESPTKRPPTSCRRSVPTRALLAHPQRLEHAAAPGRRVPRRLPASRITQPVAGAHLRQAAADELEPGAGPARVLDGRREAAQRAPSPRCAARAARAARGAAGACRGAARPSPRAAGGAAGRGRSRSAAASPSSAPDGRQCVTTPCTSIGALSDGVVITSTSCVPAGQPAVGLEQRLALADRARQLAQQRLRRAVRGHQPDRPGGGGNGGESVDHLRAPMMPYTRRLAGA